MQEQDTWWKKWIYASNRKDTIKKQEAERRKTEDIYLLPFVFLLSSLIFA